MWLVNGKERRLDLCLGCKKDSWLVTEMENSLE